MLQQFFPDNDTNHFHSSGYAEAAHGKTIGSAGTQSYQERLRIERNRRHVNRYGHSMLGRVDTNQYRRTTQPGDEAAVPARTRLNTGASRPGTANVSRPQVFKEPPSRGYNPYK